jgi:DNA-binding XRE family transcriptional regulator
MARRRADACYRELGAELRKRRIAANLTMRELAYHLDWSPSTVSRVESGYIGLPTTEVLPPPRSSRAMKHSGSPDYPGSWVTDLRARYLDGAAPISAELVVLQ